MRRLIENFSVRWVCTHSSYTRILTDCEEDPFEDDVQFSLLVEGVQVCTCGNLVTAFVLMFATYYIYNLSYPGAINSTMTFVQTSFRKLEDSVCVCVCVCLYSSTVKASSVCKMSKTYLRIRINDLVLWILVGCHMPSPIISVSENVLFHLQRRILQACSYWRENDMM